MYRTDWPARVTRCTTVIMAEEAAELNAEIRQFYTAVGVAQGRLNIAPRGGATR